MARTMSDEQERADRLMAADEWPPQSKGELANALTRAWAELDVARARAAELQQRLDAQPYESEGELVRLLAAREAEVREAREALYPLVVGCLTADAREDAPEFVNGEAEAGRRVLPTCGRCGGCGALDGVEYVDVVIPEAVLCPDCGGWGFLKNAPGGNEALRTLLRDALRRAHNAGWVHHQVGEVGRNDVGDDGWEDNDAIERSLLGPTGDGARKGDSDE